MFPSTSYPAVSYLSLAVSVKVVRSVLTGYSMGQRFSPLTLLYPIYNLYQHQQSPSVLCSQYQVPVANTRVLQLVLGSGNQYQSP